MYWGRCDESAHEGLGLYLRDLGGSGHDSDGGHHEDDWLLDVVVGGAFDHKSANLHRLGYYTWLSIQQDSGSVYTLRDTL